MPFFHVDDGFHAHKKVARLGTEDFASLALWTVAGSWCSDQLTDGFVPDYVASRFHPDYKEFASALVRVGLWEVAEHEGESGWRFHDWSGPGRNPSADQVQRERAATAERQRKFRERVKGTSKAPSDGEPQAEPNPSDPMSDANRHAVSNGVSNESVAPVVTLPVPFPSVPFRSIEEEPSSSRTATPPRDEQTTLDGATDAETKAPAAKPKRVKKPEPQRDDVDALCNRLVELMLDRGCREPTITEKWKTEARLLLDNDRVGRNRERITLDKALRLLEWSQNDHFWKGNIQSIPAFRKQYDQLRDKANEEWERRRPAIPSQRPSTTTRIVEQGVDLIRKMAAEDGVDLDNVLPFARRGELTA